MKKYFNTEGACNPKEHYMVNLDARLKRIKEEYVDRGKYFCVNRGRQYGKTTTLRALANFLSDEYLVLSMDFQMMSTDNFKDEDTFSKAFVRRLSRVLRCEAVVSDFVSDFQKKCENSSARIGFDVLFDFLSDMCGKSPNPVVLIIDEVDSASNNRVFLDFLAMLRGYYLNRDETPTFKSVILAGVYDIKNLKLKIRPEEEHKINSPWNIAAEFDVSMSFSADETEEMLREYESDHHTGMDAEAVSSEIYAYTSGYPYLVSRICKLLDEKISKLEGFEDTKKLWSRQGIDEAVKIILSTKAPLFDSMTRQLYENTEMKEMLRKILFTGKNISYNSDNITVSLASMFGFIVDEDGMVKISNRIFETRLYNLFISEEILTNAIQERAQENISLFVDNGGLNMDAVIEKFAEYFTDIYGANDDKFIEEQGRKLFLLYLKPIINGAGNFYVEARTRDLKRTDVIVDYRGEQFVIELKIWRGNEYNERGEKQLSDYLDYYRLDKGYMVSFNFNKNKRVGVEKITVGNKVIVEAVV